jgi:CP family cyanate transporter-like MFS transporter
VEVAAPVRPASTVARALVTAGVLLIALNLRAAVVAISPLLHEIQRSLGLSSSQAGLLTTLPVACFGLFGAFGPALARRWNIEVVLFVSTLLLVASFLVRLVPTTVALFGGTLIAGIAISFGNVLLPALIKREFPRDNGTMTAAYVIALSAGATLSAGFTVPLQHATGLDWRGALAVWGIFPALAALVWLPQLRQSHVLGGGAVVGLRALLRDRIAWNVTLFMGIQSLGFYTTTAWLPTYFVSHGLAASTGGWLLSASQAVNVIAVVAIPVIAARTRSLLIPLWGMGVLYAVPLAGLLVFPDRFALLWMLLLGLAQGATISLAMTFIFGRSPDAAHAAPLSSMAQSIGYLLAAIGPFAFGALRDWSGGWTAPLAALLLLLIPLMITGLAAARPGFVLAGARAGPSHP